MTYIKQPLSVIFIYHQLDQEQTEPIIKYVQSQLTTDPEKPFSRNCNLPVFSFMGNMDQEPQNPKECNIMSDRILIFPFISQYWTGDEKWRKYVEELLLWEDAQVIPIALDGTAFCISKKLEQINFIRMGDFTSYVTENMYLSIAHEIYRHAFAKDTFDADNARLKLFLSHTKQGKAGVEIAKALKSKIDNSTLSNFFDAYDIMPTSDFKSRIEKEIIESSMILIYTDSYSSSKWCQMEIQCAKECNRPMVEVNALEHYVDRKYPYATNYPVVHVETYKLTEKVLLEILVAVLTETLRHEYNQQKLNNTTGYICSNPPDLIDVLRLSNEKENAISGCITKDSEYPIVLGEKDISEHRISILYPDPPIYQHELDVLKRLNCTVYTPLTKDEVDLRGKNIGISISDPELKYLTAIGQNSNHLKFLSQETAKYILGNHGNLIYGGDLREEGFTQYLLEECQFLAGRQDDISPKVVNYRSWPIYNNKKKTIEWDAHYAPYVNNIQTDPGAPVPKNRKSKFVPPDTGEHLFWWGTSLTHMREEMIKNCDVRICAGGKFSGYKGKMPGVLEEILIALKQNKPLYLLGGFGGVVQEVTQMILRNETPIHLTMKWQTDNNLMYEELMNNYQEAANEEPTNYEKICNYLSNLNFKALHNGLSVEENLKLFTTVYYDEAIHLILKGLKEIYSE